MRVDCSYCGRRHNGKRAKEIMKRCKSDAAAHARFPPMRPFSPVNGGTPIVMTSQPTPIALHLTDSSACYSLGGTDNS